MRIDRTIAYLIGCIALVLLLFVYFEYIALLGFPDGFITSLDYAERGLASIFMTVSIAISVFSLYLGRVAVRKKIRKQLFATIAFYVLFIVGMFFIDYYYRLHLTGSGGG